MSILYKNIQRLCDEKGITGYKLCKDVGMSPNVITELRMGRRDSLAARNLEKVAEYFSVTVDSLLSADDEFQAKEKAVVQEDNSLNTNEKYLLHAYRTMTDEQRQMMDAFIKGFQHD